MITLYITPEVQDAIEAAWDAGVNDLHLIRIDRCFVTAATEDRYLDQVQEWVHMRPITEPGALLLYDPR